MQDELMLPAARTGAYAGLWRAVRGIYRGTVAETRARRWWSRRDRETARKSLRLIEMRAAGDETYFERWPLPHPDSDRIADAIVRGEW